MSVYSPPIATANYNLHTIFYPWGARQKNNRCVSEWERSGIFDRGEGCDLRATNLFINKINEFDYFLNTFFYRFIQFVDLAYINECFLYIQIRFANMDVGKCVYLGTFSLGLSHDIFVRCQPWLSD